MSENPNPRGFRRARMFVDLERVASVALRDGMTMVILDNGGEETFDLRLEDFSALLDALEVYRSGR